MNKLSLLISLCIFSSTSWSDCIGDCVNGYGTLTFAAGTKYVGQWKDGKRNGQGTYAWADGRKYVGQFKNDQIIPSQGTEYLIDGTQIVFGSPTELIGANGQTLRTNVLSNDLAGIRSESVEN